MSDVHHGPSTSNASAWPHPNGTDANDGNATPTAANPFRRGRSISTCPARRHSKSLVLGDSDIPRGISELVIEEDARDVNNDTHRPGTSLKGKFRRASMTIMKGIVGQRRSSEPAVDYQEPRPTTAYSTWHRLRQAASFRQSRSSHGAHGSLGTIYSPMPSDLPPRPVPGNGLAPPFIPHHTGGAAKAAAAMQNDFLASAREPQDWLSTDDLNDGESGIGIALTNNESNTAISMEEDTLVARVDFIAHLPLELSVQVLAFLDASQLGAASRVSKLWHETIKDQYIWRQAFLREKTTTFATSRPIQPGTGCGVPAVRPGTDWQSVYKAREELEQRWKIGNRASAVYLNGHLDSIYCLQFDENKIITGSRDKTIRVWDMRSLECRLVIGPPEVVNDTSILFDATSKPVHYASMPTGEHMSPSVPVTVSFPTHHKASILCLQYDDDMLVTGSSDSSCIVYNVRSGYRPVRRLQWHNAAVLDLAFDSKHIVTCSKDVSICVWDRETGSLIKQLKGHAGPVNSVQLRGNTIVSCSGDFRVKMWNIDSGKTVREFAGHTKGLACSQFSEDGRYIASAGSDKVIRIWDANTGECIREMQAHESLVRSLHIDSASGRLTSGSYDTDIKVFDMGTGEQILDFPRWHQSWVLSAKSDYRRIVSTGQDPKILIMDFGAGVDNVSRLESPRKYEMPREAGFI
ncbi:WD40-repeat-containing domain protein [Xylariomycetidae sp. FL0641]|nr:WD40-repeat-containing domain protein [Xylariomycetidae sp. FL0641]